MAYAPQPAHVPASATASRTFSAYELSPDQHPLYDRKTVFCDVFLRPDRRELICVGPPFRNLGSPHTVKCLGQSKPFAVQEPAWGLKRVSILRVDLRGTGIGAARSGPVNLWFGFADFDLDLSVDLSDAVPQTHASLTLATMQKDNDLQWLVDWCSWHQQVHGVGRIIFYDNRSRYEDDVYAELCRRVADVELVVVNWDYPFGPPEPFPLHFAQTVALNHCRLRFGPYTDWCINLDVDEYLCNTGLLSLESYLRQVRQPLVYLPSYVVPMGVDNSPRRCFDSSFRSARLEFDRGRKYFYMPSRIRFNEIHTAMPRRGLVSRLARATAARLLPMFGIDMPRALAGVRQATAWAKTKVRRSAHAQGKTNGEPTLFFFHFRALNTGWKYARKVVRFDQSEHVVDDRITAMRSIVDTR